VRGAELTLGHYDVEPSRIELLNQFRIQESFGIMANYIL
jgi:hypothetical protein